MTSRRTRISLLPLAAWFLAAGLSSAAAEQAASWSTNGDKDQTNLVYGDGSEESVVVFSCKPHSDAVRIFVGETDASLKPNEKATASISAGGQKATIRGRTVPNELAGVPSFIGALPATDPLFDAMSASANLVIRVAKTRTAIPLKSIGGKVRISPRRAERPRAG